MTPATKILTCLLLIILLIGFSGETIYNAAFGELETHRSDLRIRTQRLNEAKIALRKTEAECDRFARRLAFGLPVDPAKATVVYQEYLLRLADVCELKSVVISNSQPEHNEPLGFLLNFSMQGSGPTAGIGRFIDGFYKTDTLHRLSRLTVFQSLGPDSPEHSFLFDIEVLTLARHQGAGEPLQILETPSKPALQSLFSVRDVFRRPQAKPIPARKQTPTLADSFFAGFSQPANAVEPKVAAEPPVVTRPQPSPSPPPPDPRDSLRLVGIINEGSTVSALFYDPLKKQQFAVMQSQALPRLGFQAIFVGTNGDAVLVQEADQRLLELRMGDVYRKAIAAN